MKIKLIPSLSNSLLHYLPGNVFGKTDFFSAFDTFSADSSCQLLSYTHTHTHTHKKTQMTMIEHQHKLANTGIWRLISCQPGDSTVIAKRTSLTADNATNIIQEGRIYHRKRKLPLINACRWEQFSAAAKQYSPTRGSISCERSGNLCRPHEFTLIQYLHEKSSRKEIDVPCRPCQIALKHFGLTKKFITKSSL